MLILHLSSMYTDITDIPASKKRERFMRLPGLTYVGTSDWIPKERFTEFGFKSGNGMFRRGTTEGMPQGISWETQRTGNAITAIRADGFDPDF